jgi:hypothetical protein
MKKIFYLAVVLLIASCNHDTLSEVDYNIILDPENTYYAGDPVRFNIDGDVDNLLFYSGETGSQYIYRDRFVVDEDDIKSAMLSLEIMGSYGEVGCLEVWVSNTFTGLTGNGEADKKTIQEMVDGGMQGWTKIPYSDVAANEGKWTTTEFSLNDFMDNMSIAFHWCPRTHEKTQRRYWIKGFVDVEMEGAPSVSQILRDMPLVKIMMNDEEQPLHNPENKTGNGLMRVPQPNKNTGLYTEEQHLIMQSIGANQLKYALNGWVITKPRPLNNVANDKGIVIKNLQNYLHSYEYTWAKPGTYKVTFVGRNENYAGCSEIVKEFTISVLAR